MNQNDFEKALPAHHTRYPETVSDPAGCFLTGWTAIYSFLSDILVLLGYFQGAQEQKATSTQKIEDKYLEIKRVHIHIRRMSNRVGHALLQLDDR